MDKYKHTGVAGESKENVWLAVLSYDDHGLPVRLHRVPWSAHEDRRQDHYPLEVAGVMTKPQSVGETGLEGDADINRVVALVGDLRALHLGGGVDHVLLKQSVSPVIHARGLKIIITDGAAPLSIPTCCAIGEDPLYETFLLAQPLLPPPLAVGWSYISSRPIWSSCPPLWPSLFGSAQTSMSPFQSERSCGVANMVRQRPIRRLGGGKFRKQSANNRA